MTQRNRKIGVMALIFALGLSPRAVGAGVCTLSAEAAARACRNSARASRWVALANCANMTDAAARRACREQAVEDALDARLECGSQGDAREAICTGLGGAAYDPVINTADFVTTIDNPYFPLTPGTKFIYEGQTAQGVERIEFAVTYNTRVILGVTCVEVRDTVTVDGEVTEDTFDWFAQDVAGNVWYFGESTAEFVDGLPVTLEGSWTAGVDGAKPGIIMKANPAIKDFYRQEFSVENAEDVAEVLSLSEPVSVPAGSFSNCLKTEETTPLSPDALEHKFYGAGTGHVLTIDVNTGERMELIQITTF